ncbi:phosphoribosylamine--glycine ligase [Sinanaerobacter sp. ZZT-01]|uniref:phosphoribosylamine--glycine ligase n=1 Tax=Sinanaerobacter sp. ZZT-01 TaxID=3111540 RepID=UPI002D7709F6|nr:phosphoribosylamine--glycine ligase [Sinanaerobacter sp. ZZT-01]WRR94570.1 phosphoribosylamine--glycine ligase [Sinanaerobacter sp. ZZT-01]
MKVLIVGSGGREHAIAWKLSQSPRVTKLYCAPGNAGITKQAECVAVKAEDIDGICSIAKEKKIDMVVIGPEVPLSMGIVDALEKEGIPTFGPNKKCAQLEGSKAFTKAFLDRHKIPTAGYREFTDKEELKKAVGLFGYPMVLKADGLAAGKGVVIAADQSEALRAIEEMMGDKVFGSAGEKVVVEEFLTGIEASMLCFVDGNVIVPMESAQDYKRIFDGDKGPNTGGMGTYSPSLIFTDELEQQIREQILEPTIEGFKKDGLDFKGVLFIGLMIGEDGPKVIEFNNRFGDPETQSVLSRLDSDLLDIFEAVIHGTLSEQKIAWGSRKAVCVVLASEGYPGSYPKGRKISGLEAVDQDVIVFHAGTKYGNEADEDGKLPVLTSGGRVLGVTATGITHEEAREKAFANVKKIFFEGMQYRKDIGCIIKQ